MENEDAVTVAKDLLTTLFHLSDELSFNLESIIDQARIAYEGHIKIDDIEEDHLRSQAAFKVSSGPVLDLRFKNAMVWEGPDMAKGRRTPA